MYGWRLALVPLEPVVLLLTEIPVVAELVFTSLNEPLESLEGYTDDVLEADP